MASMLTSTQSFRANDSSEWLQNATFVGTTRLLTTEVEDSYEFSKLSKMTLTIVISLVTAMGLLGNTMVILIVIVFSDMHTVINFSFANLALTDWMLLLLDAVPTATDTMGGNLSAKLGCKVPIYLQYVAAEVTSLTLAFLSCDRYCLIVQPLKTLGTRTSKKIYMIMASIWIVSFVLQIPAALVSANSPETGCNEFGQSWGEELFFSYAAITLYIIPLTVIIPCYTRIICTMSTFTATEVNEDAKRRLAQRKRSIIGIFAVVVFYILMWFPCHVVHMWMAFHPDVTAQTTLYKELHTIVNVLIFLNSSVNPYLYTLLGTSFRKHLKDVGYCWLSCLRRKNANIDCVSRSDASGSTWF